MLTTDNANGTATTPAKDTNGHHRNGQHGEAPHRKAGRPLPERPALNGGTPEGPKTSLALICFDAPGGPVGDFVARLAEALARRRVGVHLFARHAFELAAPGVTVHALGEAGEGDLLQQVDEFSRRACNAFLQQFPAGGGPVGLVGFEWSTVQALSVLRGIKGLGAVLSVHSLERQRSDMAGELSRRIEAIEAEGLREAQAVLVHDAATAEVARQCQPECAARLVTARAPFPVEHFEGLADPGEVKARYQVGPIDPTILYVGDLDERYGPDLLLKAMPVILRNHKQARLVIVGDGAQYWPLRVYARYLLLEHAVRLVGDVRGQAMNELMQAADMVAVPSREATPWWPILAAWAARKPVVATHNAAPGLLAHEQDAVLCYPSPNSWVWGVEHVLNNPEVAATVARKGREKLEERFGWNAVAAQVEELLAATPAGAR